MTIASRLRANYRRKVERVVIEVVNAMAKYHGSNPWHELSEYERTMVVRQVSETGVVDGVRG